MDNGTEDTIINNEVISHGLTKKEGTICKGKDTTRTAKKKQQRQSKSCPLSGIAVVLNSGLQHKSFRSLYNSITTAIGHNIMLRSVSATTSTIQNHVLYRSNHIER